MSVISHFKPAKPVEFSPRPQFPDLVTMLQTSVRDFADRPVFGTREGGKWNWITYKQFGQRVDEARSGLAKLGVGPGDRVALIANNRLEWAIACHAAYGRGAAVVPLYENQKPAEWQHILDNSGAKLAIVANPAIRDSVEGMALPTLKNIVTLDDAGKGEGSWAHLMTRGAHSKVEAIVPSPQTLASIIYTSGTSGTPKGVAHTHKNIAASVNATVEGFPLTPEARAFSVLPWNHVAGQVGELHGIVANGGSAAIYRDKPKPEVMIPQMGEVAPTLFFAVPKIWNGVYDSAWEQIGSAPKPVRKPVNALVQKALKVQDKKLDGERLNVRDRAVVFGADKLVFRKVRNKLGGNLEHTISGAAALKPEISRFLYAAEIPITEGYGSTESSGGILINDQGAPPTGSLGKPMPGVRIELDTTVDGGDAAKNIGEVIAYGDQTETHYWQNPEATREAFTEDGGLRMGDLASAGPDGDFFFVGRRGDTGKLSNGNFVSPVPAEETLARHAWISQAVLYFDSLRDHTVALLVPNEAKALAWAGENGLGGQTLAQLVENPAFKAKMESELETAAGAIETAYERPRKFMLTAEPFTLENGLMTNTMKVKRKQVIKQYKDALVGLYEEG